MSGLHPDAIANFDAKALALLAQLPADRAPDTGQQEGFVPDHPISGRFTDAALQGVVIQTQEDRDGQEVWRRIADREGAVLLEGDCYKEFWRLAKSLHDVPFMRDSVSFGTVLDWIGKWLLSQRLAKAVPGLSTYVTDMRATSVQSLQCMIPLCEPFIQSPFTIGKTQLRSITRDEAEEWFRIPLETPPEHMPAAERKRAGLIKSLQARTIVVVDVEAEHEHASDVSWTRASLVASALRLLSKGIFFPRAGTNCVPLGLATFHKRQILTRTPEGFVGLAERLLDPESMGRWVLDDRMVGRDAPYLAMLANLFDEPRPSEFQRDLLHSVLLYSRSALTREVPEKLVHIFAALESLLLRSETEPVQGAISERVAFVVGTSATSRAAIAKSTKRVYGLRSKFVHHGLNPDSQDDLGAVKELQLLVWKFFFHAVHEQRRFTSKEEFVDAIEHRKWQ